MTEALLTAELTTVQVTGETAQNIGKVTILEALASANQPISLDSQGRCTPAGWNVDYDD